MSQPKVQQILYKRDIVFIIRPTDANAHFYGKNWDTDWVDDNLRSCGQTGFPNQLMSDSTLLFGEGSGASRVDERRGMGVLRAFPD